MARGYPQGWLRFGLLSRTATTQQAQVAGGPEPATGLVTQPSDGLSPTWRVLPRCRLAASIRSAPRRYWLRLQNRLSLQEVCQEVVESLRLLQHQEVRDPLQDAVVELRCQLADVL